jgi:hypothetical protein
VKRTAQFLAIEGLRSKGLRCPAMKSTAPLLAKQ